MKYVKINEELLTEEQKVGSLKIDLAHVKIDADYNKIASKLKEIKSKEEALIILTELPSLNKVVEKHLTDLIAKVGKSFSKILLVKQEKTET